MAEYKNILSRQGKAPGACRTPYRTGMSTFFALLLLSVGLTGIARADQLGDSRAVTFHGILKRKPCHIASDDDIYVQFGKVGINKVDGQHYIQPIPYTVRCDEQDPSLSLKLSVRGTATGFDPSALSTNATGLGIRIIRDGAPLNINEAVSIDVNSPPQLQAVPIQQSGITLAEQDFSAIATLLAEYE